MFKILLATKNKGKVKEIRSIFSDLPVKLIELPHEDIDEVNENGNNYFENAFKKAVHYAEKYHLPTLADDSGLEIDALDGAPGINSARFLGKEVGFDAKIEEILQLMTNVKIRTARFGQYLFYISRRRENIFLPKASSKAKFYQNRIKKREAVLGTTLYSSQKALMKVFQCWGRI